MNSAQIAGLIAIGLLAAAGETRSAALWGVHHAGFLPFAVRVPILLAAALAVLGAKPLAVALAAAGARFGGHRAAKAAALIAIAGLLWLLRERLFYLGDAKTMLSLYEMRHVRVDGHAFLTTLVNYGLYRAASVVTKVAPEVVFGATSVVAGVAFFAVAFRATSRLRAELGDPWLARALLCTGGIAALFAGYVENYTLFAPVLLCYLAAGVEAAASRRGLALPFALLLLAMGFHFVGFTLIPSFALLAVGRAGGVADRGRASTAGAASSRAPRRSWAVALALTGVAIAVAFALLSLSRDRTLESGGIARHLLPLRGDPFYRAFGFLSFGHAVDLANEILLLLPAGAVLLVIAVASRQAIASLGELPGAFLAAASAGTLAFLLAFNPEIGAARDWDLFAVAGIPVALLAARMITSTRAPGTATGEEPAAAPRVDRRAAAVVIAAVQLANTGAFIGVNASRAASLARADAIQSDEMRLSRHAVSYAAMFLAPVHRERGRFREELRYRETVVRHRPDQAMARLALGAALVRNGREAEGVAHVEQALAIDSTCARCYTFLGAYHFRHQRFADAEPLLARAVELDPSDPEALATRGMVLTNLDRLSEAEATLAAALAIDPDRAEARLHLGVVAQRFGRPAEARRIYESLLADPRVAEVARTLLSRMDGTNSR